MTAIIGLDLSLTATGIATMDKASKLDVHTVTTRKTGHERLNHILDTIEDRVGGYERAWDLVVVEGASYASQGSARWQLAELHGLVKHQLWLQSLPYVLVAPQARAKYATGRGNAGKDEVLLAVDRRYGHLIRVGDNNSADALVLVAMAADHYGQPLATVPQINREALAKVEWPDLQEVS